MLLCYILYNYKKYYNIQFFEHKQEIIIIQITNYKYKLQPINLLKQATILSAGQERLNSKGGAANPNYYLLLLINTS